MVRLMDVNSLTLEQKIGQMLLFAFHGTEYNEQLDAFVKELRTGGIVYFYRNIKDVAQVADLNRKIQKAAEIPFFIGIDQEGGPVLRIVSGITPLPGAMALASTPSREIYWISRAVGSDLKKLGFSINFAPVADVNNNPHNPVINSRSFGDDPEDVAWCVAQAGRGFQDGMILPTVKHFPGHGNTAVDSHLGLPVVAAGRDELERVELYPFRKAIAAGIEGVMTSHVLFPAFDGKYPASLSYNIVTKLLREEMGFDGLVCTDSLTMGAIASNFPLDEVIRLAVNAGNDLLVFCGKAELAEQRTIYRTFLQLVREGQIPEERVNDSVARILAQKRKYVSREVDPDGVGAREDLELAERLQAESVTLVHENGLIPLPPDKRVLILFPRLKLFSLVDNENQDYQSLGKFLPYDEIIVDEETDSSEISRLGGNYDIIILATYNVVAGDRQQRLFASLDRKKTVVVSLRSPYDILHLPGVENYICAYEATEPSLRHVSACLMGKSPFRGRLSIKLEER